MSEVILSAAFEKAEEAPASTERWQLDATDSHIVMTELTERRDLPSLQALLRKAKAARQTG
jgi:hypothetical protein